MKKLPLLFVFVLFAITYLNAQVASNTQWRRYRHEIFFGAGTTNFLGELGGSNTTGSHSIKDFDFKSSRYVFYGGYNYRLNERWSIGGTFSYARVFGNDKFTQETHRNSRNMHFRSPILELSPLVYFSVLTERYSRTRSVGQRGRGTTRPDIYLFTGVSGFWFNPKAQYTDGKWYALQPLGTEGQGIIPTREKYSRFSVAIPIGFGVYFPIDRRTSIGFEYGFRYTFTDYMDDVSGTYVDPSIFGSDEIARYFADPTEGSWKGAATGEQRGQSKFNDTYMFISVTLKYKLPSKKIYIPKF